MRPCVCKAKRWPSFAIGLTPAQKDLKIAAIALTNHVALVTRNQRDFAKIPGLVLQDWSI